MSLLDGREECTLNFMSDHPFYEKSKCFYDLGEPFHEEYYQADNPDTHGCHSISRDEFDALFQYFGSIKRPIFRIFFSLILFPIDLFFGCVFYSFLVTDNPFYNFFDRSGTFGLKTRKFAETVLWIFFQTCCYIIAGVIGPYNMPLACAIYLWVCIQVISTIIRKITRYTVGTKFNRTLRRRQYIKYAKYPYRIYCHSLSGTWATSELVFQTVRNVTTRFRTGRVNWEYRYLNDLRCQCIVEDPGQGKVYLKQSENSRENRPYYKVIPPSLAHDTKDFLRSTNKNVFSPSDVQCLQEQTDLPTTRILTQ